MTGYNPDPEAKRGPRRAAPALKLTNYNLKIDSISDSAARARRRERAMDPAVPQRIFDAACDGEVEEVEQFLASVAAPRDVVNCF